MYRNQEGANTFNNPGPGPTSLPVLLHGSHIVLMTLRSTIEIGVRKAIATKLMTKLVTS